MNAVTLSNNTDPFSAIGNMATAETAPQSPQALSARPEFQLPLLYKEFYPNGDIDRINRLASEQPPERQKRRPIYFGTIHVRDGRESAIVDIEGHSWTVSVHGKHINRAFSGDRVAVRLLPRGHWRLKIPPTLDLNPDPSHPATERVEPLNVQATLEGMPDDEDARSEVMHSLKQLLCDDCFGPTQGEWLTFSDLFVTVTAGFSSPQDLNQKLASYNWPRASQSAKPKFSFPERVKSVKFSTAKLPDAACAPMPTLSAFSDDAVASMSPKSPSTRSVTCDCQSRPRSINSATTLSLPDAVFQGALWRGFSAHRRATRARPRRK
jgi:hypothetical protein